jgi:putative transposase
MKDTIALLEPDGIYHVYNRANGNELLFCSDENYLYFLKKFYEYILPIANIFCYCLMPNHFHFLIRVKSRNQIDDFNPRPDRFQKPVRSESEKISQQFSNLFNAYSKAFNKQYNRKGSLFIRPFKRKLIDNETYLRKVIHYIHYNPVEAGLANSPEEWKYSSYQAIIHPHIETMVMKEEVVAYFDSLPNFIYCHSLPPDVTGID